MERSRHVSKDCTAYKAKEHGISAGGQSLAAGMPAVDPTYPLYSIACVLSAAMLLHVAFTSFVRQSWNLGVAFLCFWLFFENLANGVNSIIWADNADIKLFVYCDICQYGS